MDALSGAVGHQPCVVMSVLLHIYNYPCMSPFILTMAIQFVYFLITMYHRCKKKKSTELVNLGNAIFTEMSLPT